MSEKLVGEIKLYKPEPAAKPGCLEVGLTVIGAIVLVAFFLMHGIP